MGEAGEAGQALQHPILKGVGARADRGGLTVQVSDRQVGRYALVSGLCLPTEQPHRLVGAVRHVPDGRGDVGSAR